MSNGLPCDEENTSRLVIDIKNKLHKMRHSNRDEESCFTVIMRFVFLGLRGLGVLQPVTGALGAHFKLNCKDQLALSCSFHV